MAQLVEVKPKFYITAVYGCETKCDPTPCAEDWEPCINTDPIHPNPDGGCYKKVIVEKIICYDSDDETCNDDCEPNTLECSKAWLSILDDDTDNATKRKIKRGKY